MEHWVGKPDRWFDLIHPDDRGSLDGVMDNLRLAGEPWSQHYRIIDANGRIVWFHDQGRVLERDDRGRPVVYHGVLLDVTRKREQTHPLEASERSFRGLVECLARHLVDRDHRTWKPAGRDITYIGPQSRRAARLHSRRS